MVTIADYLSAAIMTLVTSLVVIYYPMEGAEPFSFLMVFGFSIILFSTYIYIAADMSDMVKPKYLMGNFSLPSFRGGGGSDGGGLFSRLGSGDGDYSYDEVKSSPIV